MTHWATPYIGKPHSRDADGPEEFSCWGLMRAVFRAQQGFDMPAIAVDEDGDGLHENVRAIKAAVEVGGWRKVAQAVFQEYDILLFEAPQLHCGVITKLNGIAHILHSKRGAGVCLERLRDVALGRRVEVWRRA